MRTTLHTAAAALMPDAETAIVAGSRHLTPLEAPVETIALVKQLWHQ